MNDRLGRKKHALILSLVFVALGLSGARAQEQQDQTILKGTVKKSFVIAPEVKLSSIGHRFASFAGIRGGVVLNRKFLIGVGGYGLTNTGSVTPMGYGGLVLEYSHTPGRLFHLTAGGLVGAGGFAFGESFFVAEPGVRAVINVTRWLHPGFGVSYRFVGGAGPLNSCARGPAATIGVAFGN